MELWFEFVVFPGPGWVAAAGKELAGVLRWKGFAIRPNQIFKGYVSSRGLADRPPNSNGGSVAWVASAIEDEA
ncbi:MAG: hypothetical protein BGO01_08575 [Armatimonadetes bacterium 55-13]|nr:MAG: hypothetical protein BGO01_08575 [Armatimonadetes bacterium 55-13]